MLQRIVIARIACCLIAVLTTDLHSFAQEFENLFPEFEVPWLEQESEQESETEVIETDRDSFTPATTTVAPGRMIFESAYSFIENRGTLDTNSYPEMVTRVGITDRLELRFGWNYEVGGGGSVSNGDSAGELEEPGKHRESKTLYGFKYALTKQRGWLPQSACLVQGATPTSGTETTTDFQLGYVFGWKLDNNWKLDSSIRYSATKEAGDHFNEWAPSVVVKVPLDERWNVHGEYFGVFTDGKSIGKNAQYISPGASYLINKNCEVGIRLGWGLNQDAAVFFTNVGFGIQF